MPWPRCWPSGAAFHDSTAHRRAGIWDLANDAGLRRVAGSTLGIVGFGGIGRQLARRALALEIEVLAYDPLVDDAAIEEAGVTPAALDDLHARVDAGEPAHG